MSTYIIGDTHGCYDELQQMLQLIKFCNQDILILVGDYIDRGTQNYEMLEWISKNQNRNIIFLKGNHEQEFIANVNILLDLDKKAELNTDINSIEDTKLLYDSCIYQIKKSNPIMLLYFDMYDTIRQLIYEYQISFDKILKYKNIINNMSYYYRKDNIIVVHAGFIDSYELIQEDYSSIEDFYLYARDDAYTKGGINNGVVIAGHTPTIEKDNYCCNNGKIFHYYNHEKKCYFYNIDGGICFKDENKDARLCCLRLEDRCEFYIQ